jgi:hypothetical protein
MDNKELDTAIKREVFWLEIANKATTPEAYKRARHNAEYWHAYVIKNTRLYKSKSVTTLTTEE